jgi:plasmid stability protein
MTSIQLDDALVEAARKRAASEGVSVSALVTDVLMRALEREPSEDSIIVYDHLPPGNLEINREPGEDDVAYAARLALYRELLGRS